MQASDGCAAKLRHKFVTVRKLKGLAHLQALDLMVAGACIGTYSGRWIAVTA